MRIFTTLCADKSNARNAIKSFTHITSTIWVAFGRFFSRRSVLLLKIWYVSFCWSKDR